MYRYDFFYLRFSTFLDSPFFNYNTVILAKVRRVREARPWTEFLPRHEINISLKSPPRHGRRVWKSDRQWRLPVKLLRRLLIHDPISRRREKASRKWLFRARVRSHRQINSRQPPGPTRTASASFVIGACFSRVGRPVHTWSRCAVSARIIHDESRRVEAIASSRKRAQVQRKN